MKPDRILEVINHFYLNHNLSDTDQEMIDELIKNATNKVFEIEKLNEEIDEMHDRFYAQGQLLRQYQKAIKTAIETEPQSEDDWETIITGLKSYLQDILDGEF